MDDMSDVTPVVLSLMVQSGAVPHAFAKVSVTEVRSVPVTVMVPLLSLPDTDDVPPDMAGVGPLVIWWPFASISNIGFEDADTVEVATTSTGLVFPTIDRRPHGDVEAMPTLPVDAMVNAVVAPSPTCNAAVVVAPPFTVRPVA